MIQSLAVLVLLLFSCASEQNNGSSQSTVTDSLARFNYVLQFKGILPCADCPGIETELTLVNDDLRYVMKERYIDRSVTPRVSTGEWTTLRGYKDDEDAVVYWLDPESDHEQYFLKTSDSTILMLDRNEERIQSSLNFTLTKIFEKP
jgi:copper homeostasis protein (lipoprotein)